MNENDKNKSSVSKAQSIGEVADFWDEHSLADYWEETEEVDFEVRATQRRRITVAPELYDELEAQAKARGILPETLLNLWLSEKLQTSV